MSRNIFLSFLGTGGYTPCNYWYENEGKVDNVQFIQTALSLIFYNNPTENDNAYIFLTPEAKEKNWEKLKSEMKNRNPSFSLTPVSIPPGHSEAQIWEIFETVYKHLETEDNVILDVTHAFRSIPMLGIVLMNYAKFLKKITVAGIYYGAFDVLGRPKEAEKIPIEKRNAPIFNLTSFDKLQQWSAAAENFISAGDPRKIATLLKEWATPRLAETQGGDEVARTARNLAQNLEKLYGQLSTVRGKEIREGTPFDYAKKEIKKLSELKPIPALAPLLARLGEKLSGFEKNDSLNGIKAARLCLDFGLIQQGITLLEETIITYLAENIPQLNHSDKNHRDLVSSALHIYENSIPESQWKGAACNNKAIIKKICNCPETRIFAALYRNLTGLRNDINHAGHIKPKKADDFREKLSQYLDEVESILLDGENN